MLIGMIKVIVIATTEIIGTIAAVSKMIFRIGVINSAIIEADMARG